MKSAVDGGQPVKLTEQQAMIAMGLYFCTFFPLIVLLFLRLLKIVPNWVLAVYGYSFAICALGWEIWYTFGLVSGVPVDERRAEALNRAVPQNINWILTSGFDAGAVCLVALLLMWIMYGFKPTAFERFHWPAFIVILLYFVAQNVYVEYAINAQVGTDTQLSWAPLIPTGPWWNPVLFEIKNRTITFQTQLPWVLMVPIFYALVLWRYQRRSR